MRAAFSGEARKQISLASLSRRNTNAGSPTTLLHALARAEPFFALESLEGPGGGPFSPFRLGSLLEPRGSVRSRVFFSPSGLGLLKGEMSRGERRIVGGRWVRLAVYRDLLYLERFFFSFHFISVRSIVFYFGANVFTRAGSNRPGARPCHACVQTRLLLASSCDECPYRLKTSLEVVMVKLTTPIATRDDDDYNTIGSVRRSLRIAAISRWRGKQ